MRFALILQTTLGLGILFGLGCFMAERYVDPPAVELTKRTAAAQANAAASEVEVEWQSALTAQRRIAQAAAEGPVVSSMGEAVAGGEARASALKGALAGVVELAGGTAHAAVVGARGESLVSVGDLGPQLAGGQVVKLALSGAPSAGFDRIGGAPALVAAAPFSGANGVRGVLVLATVVDDQRLASWTAKSGPGAGILLASGDEVLISALGPEKVQPIALASLKGDTLALDDRVYGVASRPLLDDSGANLRVFGLARHDSGMVADIIGRARVLVVSLGGLSLLLVLTLVLLSSSSAAPEEEDLLADEDNGWNALKDDAKSPALSLDTVVAPARKPAPTVASSLASTTVREPALAPQDGAEAPSGQLVSPVGPRSYEVPSTVGSTDASAMFDEMAQAAKARGGHTPEPVAPMSAVQESLSQEEFADLPGLRAGEMLPRPPAADPSDPPGLRGGDGASRANGPILDLPGLRAGDPVAHAVASSPLSDLPGLVVGDPSAQVQASSPLSDLPGLVVGDPSAHTASSSPLSDLPGLRVGTAGRPTAASSPPLDLPGLRVGDPGPRGSAPSDWPGLRDASRATQAPSLSDLPGLRAGDAQPQGLSDLPGLRPGEPLPRGAGLPEFRSGEPASRNSPFADLPGLRAGEQIPRLGAAPELADLPGLRGGDMLGRNPAQADPSAPRGGEVRPPVAQAPAPGFRLNDAMRGSGVPQPVDVLGPRDILRAEPPRAEPLRAEASPLGAPLPADEPSDLPGLPGGPFPSAVAPRSAEPLDLPGLKGGAPPFAANSGPALPGRGAAPPSSTPRPSGPSLDDFWKARPAGAEAVPPSEAPTQQFNPAPHSAYGHQQQSAPPSPRPAYVAPQPGGTPLPMTGTPLPNLGRDVPMPFDEEHYRIVYNEFVGSKARLGEAVDNISYEGFSSKLRSSERDLIERHGCKAVRFQVLVKDRQVSLRPQLVR